MVTIQSYTAAQPTAANRRKAAKPERPPKGINIKFGMHQPPNEPKTGCCFSTCFGWLRNLFRRQPTPVQAVTLTSPLLNHQEGPVLHSVVTEKEHSYDTFPSSEPKYEGPHQSEKTETGRSQPRPFIPLLKPNRFLVDKSGSNMVGVSEEGNLMEDGAIILKSLEGKRLGTAKLKNQVTLNDQTFHILQLNTVNPQQTAYQVLDQAAVLERLLKTAVRQAEHNGVSLMIDPQDGEQAVLFRQQRFKPLAEVLQKAPPHQYQNYLAFHVALLPLHERRTFHRSDSSDFEVGSPPGWREEKRALQRRWEMRENRQTGTNDDTKDKH